MTKWLAAFLLIAAPVWAQQPSGAGVVATLQSAATGNGAGTRLETSNQSVAVLTVNCASCSGGTTVNFEGTQDGTNYTAVQATQVGTSTTATSTTAAGITVWTFSVAGLINVQARISGYSAGTVTITGRTTGAGSISSGGGGGSASDVTIHDPNTTSQKVAVNASGQMSITCANCSGSGASAGDRSTWTFGTSSLAPGGGVFDDTPPADLTTGLTGIFRMTPKRGIHVNFRNQAGVEIATASNPLRVDPTGTTTQPIVGPNAQANIVSITANGQNVATGTLGQQYGTVVFQVAGTWTGTLTFRAKNSSGAALADISAVNLTTGAISTTTTANGMFAIQTGGIYTAQLESTAWTSGQADISIGLTGLSNAVVVAAPLTVTANAGTNLNTSALALDATVGLTQGSTTSGQKGPLVQGAVTTNAPTYVTAQTDPLSLDTSGLLRISLKDTPQNTTALKVDGSAVTQTVAGNKTNNNAAPGATNVGVLPALANTSAPSYADGNQVLLSTDVSGGLRVNCVTGCGGGTGGTAMADRAAFTYGTTQFTPIGGVYNSSITSLTSGQAGAAALTPARKTHVALFDANDAALLTTAGSLNVHVDNGTANATEAASYTTGTASVAQTIDFLQVYNAGGSGTWGRLTAGQAPRNASLPVTIASDQTPIQVSQQFLNGWPIATGVGVSNRGTQRMVLSSDSQVQAIANENVFVGGIWRGVTGLALGGAVAPTMALVDASGNQITSFGGGTQYATGAAIPTPTGTVALGWDGANVRALSTNAAGQLGVTQVGAPWSDNITQFAGSAVATGTGVSGAGIPRVTVSSDSSTIVTQATPANLNAVVVQGTAGSNAQAWWTQIGDTTNGPAAVKAASTAAVAADKALVVSVSPNTPVGVTGTFWQATQPVSAASLPLPTGASTETTLAGVKTDVDPLVNAAAGGYVRQDSTATIAKESGGNLASIKTNTDPLVTAAAGGYVRQDSTATIAKETGGNLAQIVTDLAATQPASNDTVLMAILRALVQQGTPKTAMSVRGSFGRVVSSTGDALDVNLKYPGAANDPCTGLRKASVPINQTAGAQLVTGMPGQRVYVCAVDVVTATAQNIALVEGLGTTCGSSTAGMAGGTTAATGWNFAANGGIALGNGGASVSIAATNGNNVCLLQSGAGQVSGNLVFAIQ